MKTNKTLSSLVLSVSISLLCSNAFAYGALAVGDADAKASDASTEQHFIVSGYPTYEAAKEAAMAQCLAKKLHFCSIALWYDTCGAYAKSDKQSGNAWAATEEEAKRLAVASCGKECKVIVAQCERGKSI